MAQTCLRVYHVCCLGVFFSFPPPPSKTALSHKKPALSERNFRARLLQMERKAHVLLPYLQCLLLQTFYLCDLFTYIGLLWREGTEEGLFTVSPYPVSATPSEIAFLLSSYRSALQNSLSSRTLVCLQHQRTKSVRNGTLSALHLAITKFPPSRPPHPRGQEIFCYVSMTNKMNTFS